MAEQKDIYYQGKIYVGCERQFPTRFNTADEQEYQNHLSAFVNYFTELTSYPVTGTHSFKDGQDVTGLWTVQYQCQCGRKEKHTINHCENVVMVAVPKSSNPPDELDKEAQYDWEKEFYRRMEINGYKRAEYIPEISDSVELFREFIQLGYFATPTSNKR